MKHRRLLLDTHVFLWWQLDDARLSGDARESIAGADVVFVSAASAWEVAIKMSLGKLVLHTPFAKGVLAAGFAPLAVDFAHAEALTELPMHHRAPFDRLLVAQAMVEGLTLVTHDRTLERYQTPMLFT